MPCFYTGFTALSEEEFQHHGQHRCSRPESISHYQPVNQACKITTVGQENGRSVWNRVFIASSQTSAQ